MVLVVGMVMVALGRSSEKVDHGGSHIVRKGR